MQWSAASEGYEEEVSGVEASLDGNYAKELADVGVSNPEQALGCSFDCEAKLLSDRHECFSCLLRVKS